MAKPYPPASRPVLLARWWWWLLCLMLPTPASAGFVTIAGAQEYNLAPYFSHLEDPDGTLTFEELSRPEAILRFKRLPQDYINFDISDSTQWLRVELRHIDKKHRYAEQGEWLLDVRRARLDVAELYIVRTDGSVTHMQSDLRIPYSERPIRNVNSVFPFKTTRGEHVVLFLKIKNDNATYLPIHLRTAPNFIRTDSSQELLYGMFFGGMLVMIVYNIFLLVAVRDITYFYYVAYLIPVTLFEFIDIGHGIHLFEAYPEFFHKRMILICIWSAAIAGVMFVQSYLNIARHMPVVHEILRALCIFMAVAAVISYLIPYDVALMFTAYFGSSISGVIVVLALYQWQRFDDTNAALVSGAWIFCVLGYIVYSGVATGWLPPNGFTIASLPVGTLLEATTLAFALGERIKETQARVIAARRRSITHLQRFRSFFDNAAEGIYQLSLDGRWMSANNSMARILGFVSQAVLFRKGRRAVALMFHGQQTSWSGIMSTGNVRDEITWVDESGKPRHAIHAAKLIHDRSGQPSHIEGTLIDLTERSENERAQRALLKERHEKALATAATESKSHFLKDMSYQIRTPLNAIIGFSESMREATSDRRHHQQTVRTVIRNAQTLLQLVNDILDFSKIEAGKMAMEAIDTDLMGLIRQIEHQFLPIAKEKQLTFRVDCRFPLPARIVSDPTRLRQILQNLCHQAIGQTPRGSVKVSVRWDALKQQLCIDVEDSGPGLTPEEIQQLIHHEAGQDPLGGSNISGGLGMAIVNHLARLLGGQLQVESRQGYGTRFSVSIGCRVSSQADWVNSASAAAPASAKPDTATKLQGHVLLAEDNPVNQKLIARLITKTGATVSIAENGQRALDMAQADRFDLVLMDINMPVMDGLTATREIKARGLEVPIYALTAENSREAIEECLEAGCLGYLSKPVDVPAFNAALAKHLKQVEPTPPE